MNEKQLQAVKDKLKIHDIKYQGNRVNGVYGIMENAKGVKLVLKNYSYFIDLDGNVERGFFDHGYPEPSPESSTILVNEEK